MNKHLFIINPAAGKGKTLEYIPKIQKAFLDTNEEYFIEITEKPGHATEIVKKYVKEANYRVYSIGGDGTLNEVLNGIVGTDSSLGIIPSGTGNDFIRSMKKTNNKSDILERTIKGSEELIDIAKANGRYFINISSVGIDAEIAHNASKIKKIPILPGKLAYFISIFITLFKYKSKSLYIDIDGKVNNVDTLLLAVANGKYYGGGMLVAPKANYTDGFFDVCMVKNLSKLKILFLFPRLIKGTHENIKEVTFFNSKQVKISSLKELSLNIDGEILRCSEVIYEIVHKGLKVLMPE